MTYKLVFNRDERTCSEIVMYPSQKATELLAHLKRLGFHCSTNFRTEERGSTINLEHADWRELLAAFESFIGRPVLQDGNRRVPPQSLRVSAE